MRLSVTSHSGTKQFLGCRNRLPNDGVDGGAQVGEELATLAPAEPKAPAPAEAEASAPDAAAGDDAGNRDGADNGNGAGEEAGEETGEGTPLLSDEQPQQPAQPIAPVPVRPFRRALAGASVLACARTQFASFSVFACKRRMGAVKYGVYTDDCRVKSVSGTRPVTWPSLWSSNI